MVESLIKIQQLMAESRFVEAQRLIEGHLIDKNFVGSNELMTVYFECLLSQQKKIPEELLLIHVDKIIEKDFESAHRWISFIDQSNKKIVQSRILLEIRIAEKQGLNTRLYELIEKILKLRIQNYQTEIPKLISEFVAKFFPNDLDIKLLMLSGDLLSLNLVRSEEKIRELILFCFETSSRRGLNEKLKRMIDFLSSTGKIYHLELYKSLLSLMLNGLKEKKDFKRLIEIIIYFDDVKLQLVVLHLLDQLNLENITKNYSFEIKKNKEFSLVYVSKYFPELKKYFVTERLNKKLQSDIDEMTIDLSLEKSNKRIAKEEKEHIISSEERMVPHLVEIQNYSIDQLLDLSVSLYQSEFYYASAEVAQMASKNSTNNVDLLKSKYLKITSLFHLRDYRAIIDESLEALKKAETQNDILSFLYTMAEGHIRLGENRAAVGILKKIIHIDDQYRLAKLKLEELDAI
jgi:hypothetical protein